MSLSAAAVALAVTVVCAIAAGRMAVHRGRSPRPWVWSVFFLGPLPLAVLAFVPVRHGEERA
jgi:hypothetical protein